MRSNYKAIGNLVEKVDERNHNGKIADLIGLSIDKCFIKSVANTNGTDLSKYKVIRKKDFAVSLMQVSRDEKMPIAMQSEYETAIMSPAYHIFRVKDERIILPEYMDMWFKRPEFDREATFIAVGGVRGSMPWEEFARIQLPVPSYEEQLKTVKNYQIITERIALKQKINDNLAEYLNCIFAKLVESSQTTIPLSNICEYVSEKAAFSDIGSAIYISTENILPDKQGVSFFGSISASDRVVHFRKKDVLVSNIRPYFRKMWFATTEGGCNADVLCFRAVDDKYSYLLKSIIFQGGFFDYVMSGAKGTKMPRGDKKHIMLYPIPYFPEEQLQKFNTLAISIEKNQELNRQEISVLEISKKILLATLSR